MPEREIVKFQQRRRNQNQEIEYYQYSKHNHHNCNEKPEPSLVEPPLSLLRTRLVAEIQYDYDCNAVDR